MKLFLSLAVVLIFLISSAFTRTASFDFIGTYGVDANDPSNIRLTISENHTFTYTDYSNSADKINATGTWEWKGNTLELNANNTSSPFHTKWHFESNGQIAKSRKGLLFYSLCKQD